MTHECICLSVYLLSLSLLELFRVSVEEEVHRHIPRSITRDCATEPQHLCVCHNTTITPTTIAAVTVMSTGQLSDEWLQLSVDSSSSSSNNINAAHLTGQHPVEQTNRELALVVGRDGHIHVVQWRVCRGVMCMYEEAKYTSDHTKMDGYDNNQKHASRSASMHAPESQNAMTGTLT